MTFINRRIIKRPTLFASSRRNFGNLLTHYETGQDGTTPEPGPDPDPTTPISFTVSWATNGGIIQANLVGIQDGDGTEVITLTRDDGSILATLASGSLGNHTLQHDEGTNYNTYTYTIRLDGVVQSSFTRTYEPNTPSFTTNFFSNTAKVISCGIENITNPHESYSVRLARPDDTILDTQVLNDASSFFLQFTESDYGTYDYKLLLSKWTTTSTSNPNIPPESYWVDTVIATHTQLFPRPEPTFTTSWTKSGLTINAELSSITAAHPEFYAYLCRDDGTTLATHQFQTGQTTTSLSFTETNYGTFTYQLKLGTTVVSTHTETYIRPEPTFTTSWTKSGLTINADLSSITGAHPDFYAYLCRDDGTTLATHQFQTGQTTTSLSFTEPDYGSYNYQLKLGTVVKSSHTETYVRPTPTYTASFSTNELTLTASITSITNAHNSFAITLERDDGTVLQTHTLVDGETSFTFTQTETSYATFNYIVKINGAQTDTYSASYTPPTTPTFDIALTNDDLAITATLTNIVNSDPYYTLMIHDANDTHLDGHTFATGDTTVVLTWTETSYGEKTYTKLLNGASIGTETITLTNQQQVSWGGATAIALSGGAWDSTSTAWEYLIDVNQTTSSSVFFEAYNGTTQYTDRGIEFRNVSGQTYLFCGTDDNNFQPVSLSTTTHSSISDNHPIYLNDTVSLWSFHNSPIVLGSFTVSSTLLYSGTPPPSYFLSSPRAIGDWINCADNPFTWNGTTYTSQRTGGSMKYTSDDGTSAIWTYCNSTGGNSQSGDSVKRLSSGGWEDGPGSRPNGNNSINEHNNVLFISHPNTPVEAVWGFDDPYDVSP